jgi:nucleotide-binding universal stress UspA family protein
MLQHILVPLDGSRFAEQALPLAAAIARASGGRLHLAIVHEKLPSLNRAAVLGTDLIEARHREEEEEYLSRQAERIEADHVAAPALSLLEGAPAAAISRLARRRKVDLIVMATHGLGGLDRAWLGSVADAVIRRARMPTLLVRPTARPRLLKIETVLVALDGSAAAEAALHHAAELCTAMGAECRIVRVVEPPTRRIASRIPDTAELVRRRTESAQQEAAQYLDELRERTSDLPQNTTTEVVTAPGAARAIMDAAQVHGADVIAVGGHGRGGAARMVLGSVADKIVRGAAMPVLVCPERRR